MREPQRRRVGAVADRVHLVPADRRRHGRAGAGAQRVGRDRRLRRVVLAPVDEHLARPQHLLHPPDDGVGRLRRQLLRQRLRVPAGVLAVGGLDRRVDLHALGARRLHDRVQAVGLQPVAQPLGDRAALGEPGVRARVEVEHEQVGQLRARRRRRPATAARAAPARRGWPPRRGRRPSPARTMSRVSRPVELPGLGIVTRRTHSGACRALFFSKNVWPVDAVGPAGEGHRPAGQVRQQHRRDPHVVVDHLRLGDADLREQHLVQVGDGAACRPSISHPLLAGSRLTTRRPAPGRPATPATTGAAAGPPPSTPRRPTSPTRSGSTQCASRVTSRGSVPVERRVAPRGEQPLQVAQVPVGEAGADVADVDQPALVVGHADQQRADRRPARRPWPGPPARRRRPPACGSS